MSQPDAFPILAGGPFRTLDADWAALCHRHRRSSITDRWARREPVLAGAARLADVVPPPGVDRRPLCQAVARLAAAGDDLAARALLQLLIPGLARLAARWRPRFGGMDAAGSEVIARAGLYIARLPEADATVNVAGGVLRSIERDMHDELRRERRRGVQLTSLDATATTAVARRHSAPSAEDAAFTGPLVWGAFRDAARRGTVSSSSAQVVLLHAAGHSMPELARRSGTSSSSVYRLRDHGHAQLRDDLAIAS
jgi:hypothetical protein